MLFIAAVVLRNTVTGRPNGIGRFAAEPQFAQTGQTVHSVRLAQSQGFPALLPRSTGIPTTNENEKIPTSS